MLERALRLSRFGVLAVALVWPASAAAATLSVSPTSISVSGAKGTNLPSKTVQVSNSSKGALKWSVVAPTASWLKVSPTSGTNAGTLTLTFATSGLAAGSYATTFRVTTSSGSSVTVSVSIALAAGSTLSVTCPANMSLTSSTGSSVVVNYSVSTSGGVAPISVTGTPASGSSFAVGTTQVSVVAKSSDGQSASCGFAVTVTSTATSTPSTGYGPQSTITCPSGAIAILPGTDIQAVVNSYPGATTFCIKAGTHYRTSAITPKTGDTFVGEYGAILDGTGWSTTDPNQGVFRAHNQDIDSVTIRNLVIRNMPQRAIHAYYPSSDYWIVENNEITANYAGVLVGNNATVRRNYIHNNTTGGYYLYKAANVLFDSNDISYNSTPQKVLGSTNVTFRNNFVHHNKYDGIWFDADNTGTLIEANRVEDNGREGIDYEASGQAVIRNNTARRNSVSGIFVSTSKNVEIYGNTLENNFRGIQYFVNCGAVGAGLISYDLANNSAHDNYITVGTTSGAFANGFSYISTCTSTQVAPYLNGQKSLKFTTNHYTVPTTSTKYWLWGLNSFKYWVDWQNIGQDVTGTVATP